MLGDNKISFILIKNLESQNRTKYINVIHYHIQKLVEDEKLKLNLQFINIGWWPNESIFCKAIQKTLRQLRTRDLKKRGANLIQE